MAWHVAPSLKKLRVELDAKYPKRDKRSDGSIGDARHSASVSDHNPNSRNSVNALDIDKDGINVAWLIGILKKDSRVNYIIFNRVIYSRAYGFRPRAYKGSNPHDKHVHVSLLQSKTAENNTKAWFPADTKPVVLKPVSVHKPINKPSGVKIRKKAPAFPKGPNSYYEESKGNRNIPVYGGVRMFQQELKNRGWDIDVDGRFGEQTTAVVKAFQKDKRLKRDGLVGPVTWKAIWESPVTN